MQIFLFKPAEISQTREQIVMFKKRNAVQQIGIKGPRAVTGTNVSHMARLFGVGRKRRMIMLSELQRTGKEKLAIMTEG
jgi:hypothetical protein